MTAAIYLRKSRAEENEPLEQTLRRHYETLCAYAASHDITVLAVYREIASGDRLTGRPQMLCLLNDIEKYSAVLCMDIDRLGRGAMSEQGYIFDTLRNAGVIIVTPSKTYDLSDDTDDSLIGFKALFAREEYKMIRGRLRRGTLNAIDEGCYLSNAPFGYRRIRLGKKPTLAVDEREAEAVRAVFSLCLEGKGAQAIADELTAMGFSPRRGARFSRSTVAKMLQNPVYIGKVVWTPRKNTSHSNLEEPRFVNGLHPPIIDGSTFELVQSRRKQRRSPPCRKPQHLENPLAGVLFCGVCGRAMLRKPRGIIACAASGCSVSCRLDIAEFILVEGLSICLSALTPCAPDEQFCPPVDTAALFKAELTRLKGRMERLYELFEQGVYDEETFIARKASLTQRIAQANEAAASTAVQKNADLPKKVLEPYWDANAFNRNRLLKTVVCRAEYEKPKGSPYGSAPVIRIITWRD